MPLQGKELEAHQQAVLGGPVADGGEPLGNQVQGRSLLRGVHIAHVEVAGPEGVGHPVEPVLEPAGEPLGAVPAHPVVEELDLEDPLPVSLQGRAEAGIRPPAGAQRFVVVHQQAQSHIACPRLRR